jgi:hypothetical protein
MTPSQFYERLQALCPKPLRVKLHEKTSIYVSASKEPCGSVVLSLHSLFLHAPTPVLQALVSFAFRPSSKSRTIIRQMAHLYFTKIKPPVFDPSRCCSKGIYINLQEMYHRVNRDHFESTLRISIAWSKMPNYRTFRQITFGSFDRTSLLIRINPMLDHPSVPIAFTEFVIYHEMLHSVCESKLDARGRTLVHTAEFRRREALHPYFSQAKGWEKQSCAFFRDLKNKR